MAADPAIIACPADTWVKVADAVTTGVIHRRSVRPNIYKQTIRVAGNPAPTDDSDAVEAFDETGELAISSDTAIDVYIKAVRYAGEVRADLP